jgi:exodeoxyribonuclease VII small subunit
MWRMAMAKKNEAYENMINKLEEIVNVMDSEQLTLEESMKYYEEGIKLCNKLYKTLNDAEAKIKILVNNNEEEFSQDGE